MTALPLQHLDLGQGGEARRLAILIREGAGPPVIWLGGFRSDMRATKAEALDAWAAGAGRALVRFDYAAHGESTGDFLACTISTWLEDALAVLARHTSRPPILVGSSMGGWIALLAIRAMQARGAPSPAGLVLVAPATDFTQTLMWEQFPPVVRETILRDGVWQRRSEYDPEPYPITRGLIEDGRRHLLLDALVPFDGPVRILQGLSDPDVPWQHALRTAEALTSVDVTVTLVKDGDHRLSGEADLARLVDAVASLRG